MPCTRIPMIAPQDLLESAVAEFTKSSCTLAEETVLHSVIAARKGVTANIAMRMIEASCDCSDWQSQSGVTSRVRLAEIPLDGYDHFALRLEEEAETGCIYGNLIVIRIGYIIARIYHSKRDVTPNIDRTTELARKIIHKISRNFPKVTTADPYRANDWFRDAPVPEPLRFAVPGSDDIPLSLILTDRRTLADDHISEPGRVDGVRMAEYQTYQSLKDFYAFEARAVHFGNAFQASTKFLDFTQGAVEQLDSSPSPDPFELPVPVDQVVAVSGELKVGESSCRAAVIVFRLGSIVCGYRGMTIDSDPLICVRPIVERILNRESAA